MEEESADIRVAFATADDAADYSGASEAAGECVGERAKGGVHV